MENAADALKLAVGVMIALMLASLIVYVFTYMNNLEETRTQAEFIQQVAAFNSKFNAFEKSSMYGTDLISVLGLAYANNMRANASDSKHPDGHYDPDVESSVNIIFKLKTPVVGRTTKTVYRIVDGNIHEVIGPNNVGATIPIFSAGEYSLETDSATLDKIKTIVIDGNTQVQTKTEQGVPHYDSSIGKMVIEKTETVVSATGYTDFKKRIFMSVEGETKTDGAGRIKSMTFTEK